MTGNKIPSLGFVKKKKKNTLCVVCALCVHLLERHMTEFICVTLRCERGLNLKS